MQHLHEEMVRIPLISRTRGVKHAYDPPANAADYAAIEGRYSFRQRGHRLAGSPSYNESHDLFDQFLLDPSNPAYEVLDFERISVAESLVNAPGAVR